MYTINDLKDIALKNLLNRHLENKMLLAKAMGNTHKKSSELELVIESSHSENDLVKYLKNQLED